MLPNSIDVSTLTVQVECAEPLHRIGLEAAAELVPVAEVESAETLLFIVVELPLIVLPSVLSGQIEVLIVYPATYLSGSLVIQYSEAVKGVGLPASGVAEFAVWVVEHSIAIEISSFAKLSFIAGPIAK